MAESHELHIRYVITYSTKLFSSPEIGISCLVNRVKTTISNFDASQGKITAVSKNFSKQIY